ncbi:predicted protein [Botrytis cinerea T4]|uniref:Uncharacterized protein n=1 Tax=Botryotinia fuckeliana (strain T4) TaxID=999810 RepID=G2YEK0_BOTF4|nr:predicted protein [Botrytis cinerea T4]
MNTLVLYDICCDSDTTLLNEAKIRNLSLFNLFSELIAGNICQKSIIENSNVLTNKFIYILCENRIAQTSDAPLMVQTTSPMAMLRRELYLKTFSRIFAHLYGLSKVVSIQQKPE